MPSSLPVTLLNCTHVVSPRQPLFGDATPRLNGSSPPLGVTNRLVRATSDTSKSELLAWTNANLSSTCPLATDLAFSLRSGRLLVRLLENLTGESSEISDTAFEQFHQQEGLPFDTAYLDTIFSGSSPFACFSILELMLTPSSPSASVRLHVPPRLDRRDLDGGHDHRQRGTTYPPRRAHPRKVPHLPHLPVNLPLCRASLSSPASVIGTVFPPTFRHVPLLRLYLYSPKPFIFPVYSSIKASFFRSFSAQSRSYLSFLFVNRNRPFVQQPDRKTREVENRLFVERKAREVEAASRGGARCVEAS